MWTRRLKWEMGVRSQHSIQQVVTERLLLGRRRKVAKGLAGSPSFLESLQAASLRYVSNTLIFQCHFSISRRLDPKEPSGSQRAASPTPKQASATAPSRESSRETRPQGPAGQEADGPRRTLQVDSRTQRSGRSPSVSPDRGSTPTSPYSVPQIAPLPSSTLCPICKTSDLTSTPSQPNFNTCTQCHNKVCNQCGFNPNPHLTQVTTLCAGSPIYPLPHYHAVPGPLPSTNSFPSHFPQPPASVSF